MPKPANHYETLKVPIDAAPGRIRGAYKQLAREYHPDRNQNSRESHGLMQALNAAFEVLSDPGRRADYDEWLKRFGNTSAGPASVADRIRAWIRSRKNDFGHFAHVIKPVQEPTTARWIARIAFVALVLWGLNLDREPKLHADISTLVYPAPEPGSPSPEALAFKRPFNAPNGASWPLKAAEISGYPVELNDGRSIVTVDNSRNYSDVFVKLVHMGEQPARVVRHMYIPGRSAFQCTNVRKGKYEVLYQDLGSGLSARTGTFEVVETRTDRTVNSSMMRITLARITETRPEGLRIAESEF